LNRILLKTVLSVLIGALFVWLAMRDVDLKQVQASLARVDPGLVVIYCLLFLVVHLVRIVRWGLLLKPLGQVRFGRLFTVASVGFMALMLLPLRLGEFARPILIAEKGKIRISAALATVVVERVIDALAMAGLLVLLLFLVEIHVAVPGDLRFWSVVVLLGFLALLVFLLLAYWRQAATVAVFERLLRPLSVRVAKRAGSMLQAFISGLRALPNPRLLAAFLLLTALYWGINGIGLWVMFGAFDGLEQLGLLEAFAVLSVLCVGLMIPAGPGMIGNFHYFVKLGLALFVAEAVLGSSGVAYAILVHAIQLGLQVVIGVGCLFSAHVTLRRALASGPVQVGEGLESGS
jgi:uncharacterized protein (TIRG00374 family)